MRVVVCHTRYKVTGGEDLSCEAEAALLERRGHEVIRFIKDNHELDGMSVGAAAARTLWNHGVYRELRALLQRTRPDVLHCTNLFPLISPAAYHAALAAGVPVVQALRNYRLFCLNSFLYRDSRVCEDCLGSAVPWRGVVHACYRGSRGASLAVAGMLVTHRLLGSWRRGVARFYAISEFARRRFVEAGMPSDALDVKPNFLHPDPGMGEGRGEFAVFVGRLSEEKGIHTLLDAWRLARPGVPLRIIGDGPLAGAVAAAAAASPDLHYAGRCSHDETLDTIGRARTLVMPSLWYETFGRAIIEAFAKGTPVVASNLGAMAELVDDGTTGLLVPPGDHRALAGAVRRITADTVLRYRMRKAARAAFVAGFTEDENYDRLLRIYDRARASAGGRPLSRVSEGRG